MPQWASFVVKEINISLFPLLATEQNNDNRVAKAAKVSHDAKRLECIPRSMANN